MVDIERTGGGGENRNLQRTHGAASKNNGDANSSRIPKPAKIPMT